MVYLPHCGAIWHSDRSQYGSAFCMQYKEPSYLISIQEGKVAIQLSLHGELDVGIIAVEVIKEVI